MDEKPGSGPAFPELADGDLMTLDVEHEGKAVVVAVGGEVDLVTAGRLERAFREALAGDPQVLVVDLDRVEFFTSVGLTALARVQRTTAQRGIDLRVVATSRVTLRPLEITGMLADLAVYPGRDEALAGT